MMEKKYDKDLKFVFKALLISAGILIFMQILKPFITPPDPRADEIKLMNQEIIALRGNEVVPLLRDTGGKPVMVVVYASWCGYCKQVMPMIVDTVKSGELEHIAPVFLSVDHQYGALSSYLVHSDYRGAFTPYLVKLSGMNSLSEALRSNGSHFQGHIPYIGFYYEGKAIAEIFGVMDKEKLLATAQQVK